MSLEPLSPDEEFERRLEKVMLSVSCPYCKADMVDNKCPNCGHDPSTRRRH
jgi:endogenous inhibitor of DNA gyrase (YacG/DUF329 family)